MAAEVVLVAVAAFVAATIAGVSGFGGAVVLLPVLVAVFGARGAIVVLTIAQLVGNGSRVCFNRDDVDGRREASRRPVAKVAPRDRGEHEGAERARQRGGGERCEQFDSGPAI